jgi:hypothetical protein
LLVAVSAAGVWLTDDGGRSWLQGNRGLVARYLPEEARDDAAALCVQHIERSPKRPARLFMQFHGGVFRSDGGESWVEISASGAIPRSSCTSERRQARSSGRRWREMGQRHLTAPTGLLAERIALTTRR